MLDIGRRIADAKARGTHANYSAMQSNQHLQQQHQHRPMPPPAFNDARYASDPHHRHAGSSPEYDPSTLPTPRASTAASPYAHRHGREWHHAPSYSYSSPRTATATATIPSSVPSSLRPTAAGTVTGTVTGSRHPSMQAKHPSPIAMHNVNTAHTQALKNFKGFYSAHQLNKKHSYTRSQG